MTDPGVWTDEQVSDFEDGIALQEQAEATVCIHYVNMVTQCPECDN